LEYLLLLGVAKTEVSKFILLFFSNNQVMYLKIFFDLKTLFLTLKYLVNYNIFAANIYDLEKA